MKGVENSEIGIVYLSGRFEKFKHCKAAFLNLVKSQLTVDTVIFLDSNGSLKPGSAEIHRLNCEVALLYFYSRALVWA